MKWLCALSVVFLLGCESWGSNRSVVCNTEVKGEQVDVKHTCEYDSARKRQKVTGPGG